MSTNFQVVGLPMEPFRPLFAKTDAELAELNVRRMLVDEQPGFPCRVSLTDLKVGTTVLLFAFEHHATSSPYQASGPIFVAENAVEAALEVNQVPLMLRHRLLSVRGYDRSGMMLDADVLMGDGLEAAFERMFGNKEIDYLQVHNARPGCFNCTVRRA